jgi:putative transposase
MVAAARRGEAVSAVARRYGVSHSTVLLWIGRARGRRLDRVEWEGRPDGPRSAANRTPRRIERRILQVRRFLQEVSALGEYGRDAIARELRAQGSTAPSPRTIDRILERNGAFDGRRRHRWPAPPRGWYLPAVAAGHSELDSFDIVEDLKIQQGPLLDVLTGISLHGGLVMARPAEAITARFVEAALVQFWKSVGLPDFAQFDNDTRFQGPHQFPDALGRVVRRCLTLGITPVFAPPRETGIQAAVESFNGRWQRAVWRRFQHADLAALLERSERFLAALWDRDALRRESAPTRRLLQSGPLPSLQDALNGTII